MNKLTKTAACLLFAMQMSAQTDTICEMVRGKCNYKFDYKTSERLVEYDTCRSDYGLTPIYLNPNEVLCLHLYDKGDKQLLFLRRVTVYFRDGSKKSKILKSKSNYVYLSGNDIFLVKVSTPFVQLQPKYTDYLNPKS